MIENKEFTTKNDVAVNDTNIKNGVFVFVISFVSAFIFMAIASTNGLILDDVSNYGLFERELSASLIVAFAVGAIAGIEGLCKKKNAKKQLLKLGSNLMVEIE